nr:immunoglobulin heavy chain junction region [Mus musculus]
CAGFGPW